MYRQRTGHKRLHHRILAMVLRRRLEHYDRKHNGLDLSNVYLRRDCHFYPAIFPHDSSAFRMDDGRDPQAKNRF